MSAFLDGPNRSAEFGTLAAAVGISPDTFARLKQAYGVAGKVLVKLLSTTDGPLFSGALITGAGAAVAAAAALVEAFGLVGSQPTEFDKLYEKIRAELKVVEGEIAAASRHEDQKDLDAIATDAQVIQDVASRYLQQVASLKTTDVPDKDAFIQAALQSEQLVARFKEDALWQRLADDKTIVEVEGIDARRFAPPPEAIDASLVWDYRAALPVLLKAIHARLIYLAAKNPHFRTDNAQELGEMGDLVTRIHDRIQSGIKLIPAPPPLAGEYQPLMGFMPSSQGFAHIWEKWGRACGAVDTYGGTGVIEHFPATEPEWHVFFEDPAQFKQEFPAASDADFAAQLVQGKQLRSADYPYWHAFNLLFLARSLRARTELEQRLGLPELRQLVAHLRGLSHGQFATEPAPHGIGGSLRDMVQPSPDLLAQLTADDFWYASMSGNAPSVPKGFSVATLFGGTAAVTGEFAQLFGTPPGGAAAKSVAAMVLGGEPLGKIAQA